MTDYSGKDPYPGGSPELPRGVNPANAWRDAWGNWHPGKAPPGAQTWDDRQKQGQQKQAEQQQLNDPNSVLSQEAATGQKFQQAYANGDTSWQPQLPSTQKPQQLFPSSDVWGIGKETDQGSLGASRIYTQANPQAPRQLAPEDRTGFGISGTTGNGWMTQLASWAMGTGSDKQKYIDYQHQLYKKGLYGGAKPTYGSWTPNDQQAVMHAMGLYQQYATAYQAKGNGVLTWDHFLKIYDPGPDAANGGGPSRAPLQLTDPAALQQTLQQAAQAALGRDLSKKELAHFVAAFHGKEQAAYDAAGAGKTYTSPDYGAEAQTFVDQNNGAEADQYRQASYVDALNKMLGVM